MSAPKERVLVVDDDHEIRAVLVDILRAHGCQPEEVADGRQAVSCLKAGVWDLVLTDLQMPGLDGLALIRWLKEEGARTPVILVTASADHHVCAEAQALGAGCLHKPFGIELLLAAVDAALGRSSGKKGELPAIWGGMGFALYGACGIILPALGFKL